MTIIAPIVKGTHIIKNTKSCLKRVNSKAKNLFDFATKELSQDAFLRWLIESVDDPDVAPVSQAFLNWVTKRDGEVEVIRTVAQWHRIDVVAELFYPKTNESMLLAIEDKMDSNEHDNQLKRYNEILKQWSFDKSKNGNKIIAKVYYKTSLIDENGERQRVQEAGWDTIELKEVVGFFNKYIDAAKSEIVRQYAVHISQRLKDAKEISDKPMTKWNIVNFQTWYNQMLVPCMRSAYIINNKLPKLNLEGKNYQGHYFSCFVSRPFEDRTDRSVCLEIIFRPEDGNGIAGVVYPRKDGGKGSLPDDAWNVSALEGYREDLLEVVSRQSKNEWSIFDAPRGSATRRIGVFHDAIPLEGASPAVVLKELMSAIEEFYWLFDADRDKCLPKCSRATNPVYQNYKSSKKKKRRKGKIIGAETNVRVTTSMIMDALDALIGSFHFKRKKGQARDNVASDVMDKLLPDRKDGVGAWGGHEIYRFWVRPTKLGDGVWVALELGPTQKFSDKQVALQELPRASREHMVLIGGEEFKKWRPKSNSKKYTCDLCEEKCGPSESDVWNAVRSLLVKLDKWQNEVSKRIMDQQEAGE